MIWSENLFRSYSNFWIDRNAISIQSVFQRSGALKTGGRLPKETKLLYPISGPGRGNG